MKTFTALLALMLFATGCTVGPNYKRPTIDIPGQYRGAAPSAEATVDASKSARAEQAGVGATSSAVAWRTRSGGRCSRTNSCRN